MTQNGVATTSVPAQSVFPTATNTSALGQTCWFSSSLGYQGFLGGDASVASSMADELTAMGYTVTVHQPTPNYEQWNLKGSAPVGSVIIKAWHDKASIKPPIGGIDSLPAEMIQVAAISS